jgi:hypothetical protein
VIIKPKQQNLSQMQRKRGFYAWQHGKTLSCVEI